MVTMVADRLDRWISRKRAVIWIFASGILVGIFLCYCALRAPEAIDYWRARAPLRELAREARRHRLGYEDVVKNPGAATGQPVRWFLTHPARDQWFYKGNAGMPVLWDGAPPDMVETGQSGMSHGETVVAIVAGATPQGVLLRGYSNSYRQTVAYDSTLAR